MIVNPAGGLHKYIYSGSMSELKVDEIAEFIEDFYNDNLEREIESDPTIEQETNPNDEL